MASPGYSEAPVRRLARRGGVKQPLSVVLHALEVSSVSLVSFYGGDSWFPQDIQKPPYVVLRRLARRRGVKRISGLIYKNLLRLWKESDAPRLVASSRYSEAPVRRLARRGGVKRISGLIYEETRGVLKIF
ncbi:hypothetical protein PAXINDRAFT_102927 [Paxillus involutus ATCC 200175]|uniref:Uncharacterized protein n=1 Tax=Paxillus involutus ATCC 200175 TaxID=664439 RepID=A0A0C9THS2_PAXIN|nr:hypothetical protein PAXINDRAFT_102927 [Paxillus involutus ATCC 200175]